MGSIAVSSSLKGTDEALPYTELDDASTTRPHPSAWAALSTSLVATTLARAYPAGSSMLGRTPAFAARWITPVGRNRSAAIANAPGSAQSSCTKSYEPAEASAAARDASWFARLMARS